MAAIDDRHQDIDVEDFFLHLSEAVSEEGWTRVTDKFDDSAVEQDGSISYRMSGCGSCMVRLQFVVDSVLPPPVLMLRPEVESVIPRVQASGLVHTQIEDVLGPGDAVVIIDPTSSFESLRAHSMRCVLAGPPRKLDANLPAGKKKVWDTYRARVVVRQNFPAPGMSAMLVLPLGRRHAACFQVGPVKAYSMTLQPHTQHPGKVTVAHVVFLPYRIYPVWATRHFLALARLEKARFLDYINCADLPRLTEIDASFYSAIHLRGCNRGAPLIPLSPDEDPNSVVEVVSISGDDGTNSYWKRWPRLSFVFREYLEEFLQKFGIQLSIYDCSEGKTLVPYQVLVSSSEWAMQKESVFQLFHLQQRAYRRLNGGVNAPRLGQASEPRFQANAPVRKKECFASTPTDVVVRNTFVLTREEGTMTFEQAGFYEPDDGLGGWISARNQVGGQIVRRNSD
eukprot:gb/GFBE01079308.1/.p1 GENE.gb/GFBE01079308.1/~~gb/GFBE01079308.1/.p1  ORF type:complete len:452 (+),score=51.03 gb/GFBE01079308.1/:1-1356(+)